MATSKTIWEMAYLDMYLPCAQQTKQAQNKAATSGSLRASILILSLQRN